MIQCDHFVFLTTFVDGLKPFEFHKSEVRLVPISGRKFPSQVGGPKPGPSEWAQAGPKWAQARNLGPQKIKKIKILKIKIRSAQNVGKVWISRKKILLAPFGPIWANFLRGPEKIKKI